MRAAQDWDHIAQPCLELMGELSKSDVGADFDLIFITEGSVGKIDADNIILLDTFFQIIQKKITRKFLMNSEEFKEIMAGNQKFPLLVDDYCNSIMDDIEKKETQNFYLTCQNTINFIWKHYRHKKQKPILYADPYRKISATASINKITISKGVINHVKECLPNERTYPNNNLLNKINFKNECFFSELAIFWIVAHEYFHHHNGHVFLKQYYPKLILAFEYDADCSATAALYRYVENTYGHLLDADEIKELTLYPIYWCIRNIIGDPLSETEKIETHPSWQLRMFYAINKLVTIDIPNPNYGKTPELADAVKKLIIASANYEKDYLIKNNKTNEINLIAHLYRDNPAIKDPENDAVMAAWLIAFPLILNYNKRLPCDLFMQFPQNYNNPEYKTLYGKKFNHHYKICYKIRYDF